MGADPIRADAFAAFDRLAPAGPLGVAVSGGGDSMALMRLAAEWARETGRSLAVASVDHGLRSESADETRLVVETARRLDLPADGLTWEGWDRRGNLSAAARDARRALLANWARARGIAAIMLGHTLDDQAETVLMRLGRGAGVDGLSGMAATSRSHGVLWLRPLLSARRDGLRDWLRAEGAPWVDDPTNDDPKYDRVKARKALAALGDLGVTATGVAATAARLRDARDALDEAASRLGQEAAKWGACGELRLALDPLRAAPRETTRRLFRAALTRVAGAAYGPRAEAEASLLTAIFGMRLGGGRALHGCLVRPDGPRGVVISRETAAIDPTPAPIAADDLLWDGRFRLTRAAPLDGAAIAPLGEAGARRLSALEDAGAWRPPADWLAAPRAARIATPALWRGAALAAAPVAGYGDAVTARFIGAEADWGDPSRPRP